MAVIQRDIVSIFGEALELASADERSHFLEAACENDPGLRAEIDNLLAAHEQARDFLVLNERRSTAIKTSERLGTSVGNYKLQEILGEGGMGIVYLAEQQAPVRRQVALKIIKPGMDTRQVIARFEAERQALALMDHPNIARVFDAGITESGLPYFVMELVRGLPVTEYCHSLELQKKLGIFIAVCQAVQHAHQKGVIHRDLKPGNVMIALHDGTPVVKVIDFGVAKAIGRQLTDHSVHTAHAQLIGTPLYMSPEQAELSGVDIDTRSDIYSLGVLLYEILTGATPFDKQRLQNTSFDEMRRIIREEEPCRPSQRLSTYGPPDISTVSQSRRTGPTHQKSTFTTHSAFRAPQLAELDWVVMKALEKERDRRYESASALATDLQRFLADEPVQACPPSRWYRLQKWSRRNPVTTVLAAAAALLVISLAGGAYWHNQRLTAALAVSERLKNEGLAREAVLRRENFASDMQRAAYFRTAGKNAEAQQVLGRHFQSVETTDSRGLAWNYLWNVTREPEPERVLTGHEADILSADVSADGKLLASADRGGQIFIWDVTTGQKVHSLHYSDQEVTCVRFSPDSTRLATAGQDRTIRLWDVTTWRETARLEKHVHTVTCVTWSPDGQRLASCGRGNFVHIWNAESGALESSLPEHTDVVRCLTWSPNGQWLATADGNQGVLLWNVSDWQLRGSLPFRDLTGNNRAVLAIAFSPDSELVAYGGYGPQLFVAEVASLKERFRVLEGHIWSLAFLSADCLIVGTGDDCGLLYLDRQQAVANWFRRGLGAHGTVRAALPVRDGQLLVSACEEARTIKIWQVAELLGFAREVGSGLPVALAPTGQFLASSPGKKPVLQVQSTADASVVTSLQYLRRDGCSAVFSPAGDLLAAPLPKKAEPVAVWNAHTWQGTQFLPFAGAPPTKLLFSHDATWLAATLQGRAVGAWNLKSGKWHEILPKDPALADEPDHAAIAFSPVENLLAAAPWNAQHITLWRPEENQVTRHLPGGPIDSLAFSPEGKVLAAGGDEVISLWEVSSGSLLAKILVDETKGVRCLAFAPDGAILAGVNSDCTLRLWDLHSHRELVAAQLPGLPLWLQFLPTGQLAVGCLPNTVVRFSTNSSR